MANSSSIVNLKNKVIKDLITDERIVTAIDSSEYKIAEDLVNTHIFDYHQNPFTLDKSITFLTIQVHIPEAFHYESNAIFLKPTVEIWIVSHYEHMRVNNIPKVKCNRNDYLSILIDENLNGKSYGYGGLTLAINEEGTFQSDYSYRRMTFVTTDLNNSRCEYV
jgi:hypothetical protein